MQPTYPQNALDPNAGQPAQTPPADPPAADESAGTLVEEPAAAPSSSTSTKVGDVVQFSATDAISGTQVTGFGQVLDVDHDDEGNARYTVARLDVLGGHLTDDDLVED